MTVLPKKTLARDIGIRAPARSYLAPGIKSIDRRIDAPAYRFLAFFFLLLRRSLLCRVCAGRSTAHWKFQGDGRRGRRRRFSVLCLVIGQREGEKERVRRMNSRARGCGNSIKREKRGARGTGGDFQVGWMEYFRFVMERLIASIGKYIGLLVPFFYVSLRILKIVQVGCLSASAYILKTVAGRRIKSSIHKNDVKNIGRKS